MIQDGKLAHTFVQSSISVLHNYPGILWRGKWLIITILLLGLLASAGYIEYSSPVFKASATVLIDQKLVESSNFLDPVRRGDIDKNITQNELNILKSQTLLLDVASHLRDRRYVDSANQKLMLILRTEHNDTASVLSSPERIAERLDDQVDVEITPSTDLIQINAKSSDPKEAALIANVYAKVYYERNLQTSRSKSRSFREFLEKQVRDRQRFLSQTEDSLQGYMRRHGIVLLDDESKKMIDQLSKLEAERDEVDINIQSVSKTLALYEEELPNQVKNVSKAIGEADDSYIRLLQEQIAKTEVTRDVMISQNASSAGSTLYNSKLKEIDDQISTMRNHLQERTKQFLGSLNPGNESGTETAGYLKQFKQKIAEAKIELEALQERKKALNSAIEQYDRQFSQIPAKSLEYARLQRAKLGQEKLYVTVQEKYNEATITEQSKFGYIDIVDSAIVPSRPSSPKSTLLLALGAVLGLSIGVTTVLMKERFDIKIQNPEELKKDGFDVLATVMHIEGEKEDPGNHPLFLLSATFSPASEAIRQLRTNLRFSHREKNVKTILVTSTGPGEGKTTIVANLGIAFAQEKKRVLLVDADLRKPSLHSLFSIPEAPGLTEYLTTKQSLHWITQKTDVRNLFITPGGSTTRLPTEILGSERMQEFISEAVQNRDIVIFDSSPILAGADSTILSTYIDMVLMVVAAGETRMTEFKQAVEHLTEITKTNPGIVLNNFNLHHAYGPVYGHSIYGYYRYSKQN